MRMMAHRTPVSSADPVLLSDLKTHLRVEHDDEDAAIAAMGRAAAGELEHFAQIALLTQTIRVTIFDPTCGQSHLRLPIGPAALDATATVSVDGEDFTGFTFEGGTRPCIRWNAAFLELVPDRITVEYIAGFGADAAAIPHDLRQAVMDQAAAYYDLRGPSDSRMGGASPHLARIGARYRRINL